MRFDVHVEVSLRPGISDPAGQTVERALPALGFTGAEGVRVGKSIRFSVEADSEAAANEQVTDMCDRFLTNPVIEDSTITIAAASTVTT